MYLFTAADVSVESYPEQKTGGMNTYRIPKGIKVTHKATGIIVICEKHRGQYKNREAAFEELNAKLAELQKGVTS